MLNQIPSTKETWEHYVAKVLSIILTELERKDEK